MSEFWTLVGFEYKKLFKRRMVWITLAVMLTLTVFSAVAPLIGGVYVDGQRVEGTWEMNERDMAYAKALSGTPLNEENLKKVREAYKQLPEGTVFVSAVEVFDKYAAPLSGAVEHGGTDEPYKRRAGQYLSSGRKAL